MYLLHVLIYIFYIIYININIFIFIIIITINVITIIIETIDGKTWVLNNRLIRHTSIFIKTSFRRALLRFQVHTMILRSKIQFSSVLSKSFGFCKNKRSKQNVS